MLCGGRISTGMMAELGAVLSAEVGPGDSIVCDLTGLGDEPPPDRDESTIHGISIAMGRVVAYGVDAWKARGDREELEGA